MSNKSKKTSPASQSFVESIARGLSEAKNSKKPSKKKQAKKPSKSKQTSSLVKKKKDHKKKTQDKLDTGIFGNLVSEINDLLAAEAGQDIDGFKEVINKSNVEKQIKPHLDSLADTFGQQKVQEEVQSPTELGKDEYDWDAYEERKKEYFEQKNDHDVNWRLAEEKAQSKQKKPIVTDSTADDEMSRIQEASQQQVIITDQTPLEYKPNPDMWDASIRQKDYANRLQHSVLEPDSLTPSNHINIPTLREEAPPSVDP